MKNKLMTFAKLNALILLCLQNTPMHSGFSGRSAEIAANKYSDARSAYFHPSQIAAVNTSNCPQQQCSNSNNTITTYVPTFVVQLNDVTGKIILNGNGHVFNTPTNGFNIETSIFSVHIFPKSNAINGKKITYDTNDGTYIIAYTLKDPAGSSIYKEFDQGLTLATLPHQITLVPNPAAPATPAAADTNNTTSQAAIWATTTQNNTQMIAQSIFIPNLTTITQQSLRQQIINGISPIAQKFLFSQSGNNIYAMPISGTFDADNSTSTPSYSLVQPPFSSSTATTGKAIGSFGISLDDTPLLTFTNPAKIAFTQADLAQGLILNVCIFPSSSGNNYPVVATLRTMDGLKLQKTSAIYYVNSTTNQPLAQQPTTYLQTLPSTISIQYATSGTTLNSSTQPLLTTSFLNSTINSQNQTLANQAFTINGTLNLRFIILRPIGGNFMVNMV